MNTHLKWWYLDGESESTPPEEQASGITFSDVGEGWMIATVTPGDGDGRIIVYRIGSAVNDFPVDGVEYEAGEEIGIGNFVAVSGDVTEYDLSGIDSETEVFWRVFEYNGNGTNRVYNIDAATGNPNSETTTAPADLAITLIAGNSVASNSPNSQRQFANSSNIWCQINLGDATEIKLDATVGTSSASVNDPRVYPGFETVSPLTMNVLGSGTGTESCTLSSTGAKTTSQIDITGQVIREGKLHVLENGGNDTADPALTSAVLTITRPYERVISVVNEPNTVVVSNSPNSEQLVTGTGIMQGPFDTTRWYQMRLQLRIPSPGNSSSANTPRVYLAYSLNGSTVAGIIGSGSGGDACSVAATGDIVQTNLITMPEAAKGAAVYICIVSNGGDGAADFTMRNVFYNYRYS